MGLAVLTGAGLIPASIEKPAHVHCTIDVMTNAQGNATVSLDELRNETYLNTATSFKICTLNDMQAYGTILDGSGAGIGWIDEIKLSGGIASEDGEYLQVTEGAPAVFETGVANSTVQLDFYLVMSTGVTEVEIKPEDFGGYFYVEAQTLFRREDNGQDMAAELIFPRIKIQSAFTLTMAANGDPSTFTFTMDAFPAYTRFDRTKKRMVVIQILGEDEVGKEQGGHIHEEALEGDTPTYDELNADGTIDSDEDPATTPFNVKGSKKIATVANDVNKADSQANQDQTTVVAKAKSINIITNVDTLKSFASTNPNQGTGKWVGLDIDTGVKDITKVKYNGAQLTQADVDEAASVGVGKGHFVLWLKAESTFPKTITLSGEGKEETTIEITLNK